jgi:hypothetical protein
VRRDLDFYPTPDWATRVLLARIQIGGCVLEPCVGRGDIAHVVERDARVDCVLTNDIDRQRKAHTHQDATDPAFWRAVSGAVSWTITNPAFNVAEKILPLALGIGRMAMLLRLTYLEPCKGRAEWLAVHPPNQLIVLPRMSFTGDGKTDSVTCAWFVWDDSENQIIEVVPPRADAVKLPLSA